MKAKILIVGAGEIGRALAKILEKKAHVKFWDAKPSLCSEKNFAKLVEEADFIFLCIPSSVIDTVARQLKPLIGKRTIVVSLTKGIANGEGLFSAEVLQRTFGRGRVAVLGGPMLAEELRRDVPTGATLGSTKNVFTEVNHLFKNTNLGLEHSTDIQGVSVAGVLKNMYAIGLGMLDGLNLGENAKGVFKTLALQEMEWAIKRLGGKQGTALSLAGVGDLDATGGSSFSSNFTLGQKVVKGGVGKSWSEGFASLDALSKRFGVHNLPPLLSAIRKAVKNPKKAEKLMTDLVLL